MERPDVMAVFASQYWVAHAEQLRRLGLGSRTPALAVGRGEIVRVLPGVVGLPGHVDDTLSRAMSLHLAARGRGFVSGVTAGRLHGLRQMRREPVEYTLPRQHRMSAPSWARIVRSSWPDDEPRPARDDRIVVSSPPRMLLDLAASLPRHRFERAAEDAWHRELVTPDRLVDYLARIRRSGRSGIIELERWLELAGERRRPAESGLEQLLARLAERAGLPEPERQHLLRLTSGMTIRLDLAWPDVRLALEPGHSWWHGGKLGQRKDQTRDRECGALGWQVMRFDESVWERQAEAVRQIADTYRQRQATRAS